MGRFAFSIQVLSAKKLYSGFLKKNFFFHKICFKIKVSNTLKFPVIFTEKAANPSKEGLFWKSLVPFFRRKYVLSVGYKKKPLGKSVFLC